MIIWVGQWKDFFGLHPAASGLLFHERLVPLLQALAHPHLATTLIGAGTLLLLAVGNRLLGMVRGMERLPAPLLAMVAATAAQALGQFDGVATIGSAFGGIPRELPGFSWPTSSWFESWRVPVMPSATTAVSSDSIAPNKAMANAGPTSCR